MIYVLMDTDVYSSHQAIVEGPAGFDVQAANAEYTESGTELPFRSWLCLTHGFKPVECREVEVSYFWPMTRPPNNPVPAPQINPA